MRFSDVIGKSWDDNRLFSVLVELTYACNLNCFFCYNDLGLRGRPLTTEQHLQLFDDLAEMHVFQLVLTGGEPLAHPDFFRLGARARELGFVVRLKTNGHALDPARARRVRDEIDPFMVETSLHGARAQTHDQQTRVAGSFDTLLANLRSAREIGLRLRLNATLTRWNENEVEEMLDLGAELGVPLHIDPIVTPRDDGDQSPLEISPSAESVRRLLELQRDRGRQAAAAEADDQESVQTFDVGRQADDLLPRHAPKKHCGAGSGGVAIDPMGNVFPCVQWRRPVGNLHEQSIREIWLGSEALDEVRDATEQVKEKLSGLGAWGSRLNFCPGSATQETGSPLGIYDSARRRADAATSILDEPPPTSQEDPERPARRPLLPVVG
ncbi:MAG: radical SAM protein [Acidobacteriota bacterium]